MLAATGCSGTSAPSAAPASPAGPSSAAASKPAAGASGAASASVKPAASAAASAGPGSKPVAGGSTAASAAVGQLTAVKISNPSPAVSILPFYAALDQGFFRKQGLDASIIQMSGTIAQTALSKGEIQFMNSPSDAVIGATNGFPFKIVYSAWESAPWTLVGKAEFKSVQDLKGKTIATNRPGSSPYAYLEAGLKKNGLTVKDVNLLFLTATQDDYAQLIAGKIDAAVLSPPFDTQAADQGFHEILFLGDQLQIPYIGLATTEANIKDHRKDVVGAIKGLLDAGDWIKSHPAESAGLIVKNVGVTQAVAEQSYKRMAPLLTKTGETSPDGIQQEVTVVASVAGKELKLSSQDAVDFAPLHEAQAAR
jgi:NitT/TauT family transport system substrate-binding protein